MPSELLAFCVVAAVFSLSPGPDTVLVVNRALSWGRRHAFLTALGSASGLIVWGVLSALGLAAVFAASATAFTVVRIAGACYLVLLGIGAFLRAHRRAGELGPGSSDDAQKPLPSRLFRQGLLTNVLNPKAGVFFVAILPQFVTPQDNLLSATLVFAVVDAVLSLLALSLYTMLALAAGGLLRRPRARRVADRVTGTILVGLGARLALEPR